MKTDDGKARLRREEVRDNRELFYVALTRAKYKLYIPKFSEEPYAKGPLSYIVGAAINNAWGGGLPDSRMLRFVDTRGAETVSDPPLAVCEDRLKGMPKKTTHKIRPVLPKPLFPDISVNFAGRKIDVESYSSIKEDMVEPGHLDDIREGSWITYYDESGYAKREDDRVSGGDIHEDVVSSPGRKDMAIPPGSSAGTMLHEILEEIDFGSVGKSSSADDLLKDEEISRIIAKKLKRFGFPRDPRDEAVCIREAARMIWNTLNTTLADPGRSLSSLVASDKITELEFYYPMPKPGDIGSPKKKICRDGFITGYIDLVFRMGGRYYILDWKSNYLEEGYSAHAINENMASSGYDLQYKVYSVAVLKWLRSSIERFDYERDFGGIYYIYMRGMDPARPGEGYIHIRPESERKINLYEKEIFRLVSEKARS